MATGKADVDTTALLGGKQLRVFGRAPWPDTEAEQEEMWAPMIEQLREICDYVHTSPTTAPIPYLPTPATTDHPARWPATTAGTCFHSDDTAETRALGSAHSIGSMIGWYHRPAPVAKSTL